MGFEIKQFEEIFSEQWLSFCDKNSNCWLHHKGIAFLNDRKNLSFVLMENKQIVAICPFVVELKTQDNKEYALGSLFGLSNPSPIIADGIDGEKYRKKINQTLYEHLGYLAKTNEVAKIGFNLSSLHYTRTPCFGNTETRKHGNTETRKHGNTETRKHGNISIWFFRCFPKNDFVGFNKN